MKNNFYEGVSKKRSRRRRFTSLVLVLSLFVTSGVSWSLHGVGITMANESECGQEEHKHTDECYEKQLVCGLEEDENHIHSDECYETKLVCGKTEHVHDEECYIDSEGRELLSNDDLDEVVIEGAVINPNGDIVIGDNKDEENSQAEEAAVEAATEFAESSPEENFFVMDSPQLMLGDGVQIFDAQDDQNAPYINPGTIDTIDNIAEGIKFTLFDYGDSSLESQTNNYGFDGNWTQNGFVLDKPYTHGSVSATGINTGRNIEQDIMFFSYGTPVPNGILPSEGYEFYNYTEGEGESRIQYYKPDKNSYAGDYNADPQYSGNRPVSDIVDKTLTNSEGKFDINGYPTVNADGHHSLDYLFNDEDWIEGGETYKKVYKDVNHLLQKKGNFLTFNSDKNYAYFDKETSDFTVYDKTYPVINENHHKIGDIDFTHLTKISDTEAVPTEYKDDKPEFKIGFFPFDEYDPKRRDPNYDGDKYNHHFGMKMEAKFVNPTEENLVDPVSFKYSGDDDMWVFVDGKLVLDIGGIHEPAGGMIDFTNGLVWTQDNGNAGSDMETVKQQLIQSGVITNDADWEALPMPIGTDTNGSGNKWIVKPLTDYLGDAWDAPDGDGNKKPHDIKMFYLERGGCYSNLAMEMNLPTLKPLSVTKDVKYGEHLDKTYDDIDYWFQVYEWDKSNEKWVIPQSDHPDSPLYLKDNRFKIKAGERKKFDDLGQDRKFRVVEIGYGNNPQNNGPEVEMSSEVFKKVTVTDQNGEETTLSIIDGAAETEGAVLKDMNSYNFENTIKEEFTDINVKKKWSPELKPNSPLKDFVVKFKVMRTDSVTGEVKQVALKNDEGIKKRTFTISSQKWNEGVTINHLLSRYGDHFYTYTVEELNVPKGYKAAYGTDASGAMVITNTDVTKMEINVKKEWENTSSNDKEVKLRLTRQRVGYQDSTPTWVKVNIVDEAGNLIKSYSTEQYDGVDIKNYKGVYAGGAAEIRCELPEGVEVIDPDNPVKSSSTISAKYDDGFVVLDNLALTNPDNPSVPNEVTIKVTSNTAKDAKMILHHSFTRGENGWIPNGSTLSYTSDAGAYAKQDCLEVTDRYKAWSGARLNLDPALFKVNKTYTFSVYVKSPAATRFKMTFNNGLGHFEPITNPFVNASPGEWVQLTGTIKLPDEIDPYGMYLLVETVPEGDDYDNYPCEADTFYMDEFIAIEGRDGIRVNSPDKTDEPDGTVEITPDRTVYSIAFNDTVGDWISRGDAQLSYEHDTKNHLDYMAVRGRNASWHGAQLSNSVMGLELGHTYHINAYVQGDGGNSNQNDVKITVDYGRAGTGEGNGQYKSLDQTGVIKEPGNNYLGSSISGDIFIKDYADLDNLYLVFESVSSSDPFRVHNITITDVTEPYTPPAMKGYHVANGRYYSNNSLYITELEEDSVTNPMTLLGKYENDPDFDVKEIILDKDSGWTYNWNNTTNDPDHYIEENVQSYLYKYYIEEVAIHDIANDQWINVTNDAKLLTGESNDTDKSYLVTYMNNGVATNDAANPILVKNKYIWYKLPDTGGIGVDFIYAIGLFLMITGLIGGTALIRRERRSD